MPQTRKNAKTAASCTHTPHVKHTLMQKHARAHTHARSHTHARHPADAHTDMQKHTPKTQILSCIHMLPSLLPHVSQNVYECTATRRGYLKNLCCRQFDFSPGKDDEKARDVRDLFPFQPPVQKMLLIPLLKGRWIGYRIGETYYLHQHPFID